MVIDLTGEPAEKRPRVERGPRAGSSPSAPAARTPRSAHGNVGALEEALERAQAELETEQHRVDTTDFPRPQTLQQRLMGYFPESPEETAADNNLYRLECKVKRLRRELAAARETESARKSLRKASAARPAECVYLLTTAQGSCYCGWTDDFESRLKKHRGELSGGAVATTMKAKMGQVWNLACLVRGFPNAKAARQFEAAWKALRKAHRPVLPQGVPISTRRARSLLLLL
jgi:predicted GIY-YIG superfamily endonuclease